MLDPKIIVRMPNWLGDLVMGTPVLGALRGCFPKAHITVMVSRQLAPLLEKDPNIDEIYPFERRKSLLGKFIQRSQILTGLQREYDIGVLLTNSLSSAWWFYSSKVRQRIGYAKGLLREALLTEAVKKEGKKHQVEEYLALLRPLGILEKPYPLSLFVTEEEKQRGKELLYEKGFKKGQVLVGINPSAAYGPAKCWPEENFRKLLQRLLQNKEVFLLFFGDAKSKKSVDRIVEGFSERVLNLAGLTTLRELLYLTANLDLLVTNDSGPMHVAAALDIPLVALFGSTDIEKTGPYKKEGAISKRVSCSPCFLRECPIDFRCMKQITVDEVYALCKKNLKEKLCLKPSFEKFPLTL